MDIKVLLEACEVAEKEALTTRNQSKYLDSIYLQDALYVLEGERMTDQISEDEYQKTLKYYKIRIMQVVASNDSD